MSEAILTKPFADYCHARRAGDLLYLAGQGCRDPHSDAYAGLVQHLDGTIVRYDIQEQTRGVFRNIDSVLLSEGLDKHHLVDVTVFLIHKEDFAGMNAVWNAYFQDATPPARTTVFVQGLPGHNFVEMKAIATRHRPG